MNEFNYQVLEKLTQIREDLATSLNEQSHLKIKLKKHESEIEVLKTQHIECPARKKSDSFWSLAKDFVIIGSCISTIVAGIKLIEILK